MTPEETQLLQNLAFRLDKLEKSDRMVLSKDLELQNGRNIQSALGTGTKIGTATAQKIGFWNATPVIQHATTGQGGTFEANSAPNMNGEDSTHTGGLGSTAYTFGDVVRA